MKENMTFEQEKRNEFLYVIFNSVFVCACISMAIQYATWYFLKYKVDVLEQNSFDTYFWLRIVLTPLMKGAAFFIPFLILFIRRHKPFSTVVSPAKADLSPWYIVLGVPAAFCLGLSAAWLAQMFNGFLQARGYIIHEYMLPFGNSQVMNFCAVMIPALIESCFHEVTYRGFACDRFRGVNTVAAIVFSAMIPAMLSYSIVKFAFIFVVGLVSAYVFCKSGSILVSLPVTFVSYGIFNYYMYCGVCSWLFALIAFCIGAVALGALFIVRGRRVVMPAPYFSDDEYERCNGKECIKGTLKAFAFWFFIILSVFVMIFNYVSKPDFVIGNHSSVIESEGTTSGETIIQPDQQ